jgi:hypothetical protein
MAILDPNIIINSLPSDSKPKGLEKLGKLTLSRALTLKETTQPAIDKILLELGIQNGQIPDFCVPADILNKILVTRNTIVDTLTTFSNALNTLSKTVTDTSNFLKITLDVITAIKIAKIALNAVNKAAPVAPGATTAAIQDLNEGQAALTFDNLGNPRLQAIKKGVDSTVVPISITAGIVTTILDNIKLVDAVLTKCLTNPSLVTIPVELTQVQTAQTAAASNITNYKEYTIEIIEQPYTNTVSRKKAVAYKDGIPVLETEYSFTTQPQLLIDQLKLKINSEF